MCLGRPGWCLTHTARAAPSDLAPLFFPQEFIINTPTDTATKWWIGAAGQTATHTVVFARLILEEGDVGVHNFIVPVRDMETHKPMPGACDAC